MPAQHNTHLPRSITNSVLILYQLCINSVQLEYKIISILSGSQYVADSAVNLPPPIHYTFIFHATMLHAPVAHVYRCLIINAYRQ